MKLVALCLIAVCCWSLDYVSANTNKRNLQLRKLKEVLRQFKDVKAKHPENKTVNTPPQDIEDCCSLPALQCFRVILHNEFNVTGPLYRSLGQSLTKSTMDFCNSRNVNSDCQTCQSHPKANTQVFFNRLESLLQKAIDGLIMN